ncbi:hypothetical protein KGF56_004077 [Candida oxycetoniae]|uniref:Major facilitator superfamily (MFS) profile domain-containing protein n=1 Tax=Candida oxycetoniae TaxID=497107 RepID=A0AAI9WWQ5_9ASCO|nr:uncharacterized protein KGF56_004077 [Candida oxycetoniae]KAI3403188.2 hypothetical protein KGF56_004077 [Candida oxycetoniae]
MSNLTEEKIKVHSSQHSSIDDNYSQIAPGSNSHVGKKSFKDRFRFIHSSIDDNCSQIAPGSNSHGGKKSFKDRFRFIPDTSDHPPQVFNKTLYFSIFLFGLFGAARGIDEGNISGNLSNPSFIARFGLNNPQKTKDELANLKSNITSMVQLGAIGGAIISMKSVDFLGRVRALQFVCIIWIVGVIIQISSSSVGQLYAGRLIEGLAVGQTAAIGPIYMSEVAPSPIRGLANCIFAGAVYLGIMMGYFVNYGSVLHIPATNNSDGGINDKQWRVTLSVKLIMSGLIFILSFFITVESPRWLLKCGKTQDAVAKLSKLRHLPNDHPYIIAEISDINEQVMVEKEATKNSSLLNNFKQMFTNKSIAYRFVFIAGATQVLGQWSGANAVTIYASELFSLVGIKGIDKLKMSAVLGVVKFVSAYLAAFFIIDILGRKRSLYIGILGQMCCLLYYAIFLTVVPQAANEGAVITGSAKRASTGALAAIFLSGTFWTVGFNSIQYLIGAEIFPLGIRSFAQSMVMILHFANQYGNSKALPKMMIALNPYGAFYFFVGVLALALVWSFFLPELKGRSLESIEEVFTLPWYNLRRCNKLVPDHSQIHKIRYTTSRGNTGFDHIQYDMEKCKPSVEYVDDLMRSRNSDGDGEDKEDEKKI